jgi:hypothetical protein
MMRSSPPRVEGGRPLRDVYSVALGVALVLAVEQVIDLERAGLPLRGEALVTFLAFIATGFSLYHWAARFIDLFFARADPRPVSATVTALAVGSAELLLLIALSILIARPSVFLGGLAAVFAFEVAAGLALRATNGYEGIEGFGRAYLVVNAAAAGAALVSIPVARVADAELATGLLALAVSWGRAIAFYRVGFRFLFGSPGDAR